MINELLHRDHRHHDASDTAAHAAMGAAAGIVGTLLIHGLMTGQQKYLPETSPPMRGDPGEFMLKQAKRAMPDRIAEHVPKSVEKASAKALQFGYGATFGAAYGAIRGAHAGSMLLDGSVVG